MDLGFKNVKVLHLPHNLDQDWVQKGFPVEGDAVAADPRQD